MAVQQANQLTSVFAQLRAGTWPSNVPIMGAYPLFWERWIHMTDSAVYHYQTANLPSFFIQGEEDFNVPPAQAERFRTAITHEPVDVVVLDSVNHFLTLPDEPSVDQRLIDAVIDWLETNKLLTSVDEHSPLDQASIRVFTDGQDHLVIEGKNGVRPGKVRVSDLSGRITLDATQVFEEWRVNIQDWQSGVYLVQVETEDGQRLATKVWID